METAEASSLNKNQRAINTQKKIDQRTPTECLEWSDEDWKDAHNELRDLPYLTTDPKLNYEINNSFHTVAEIRGLSNMSEYSSDAPIEVIDPRLIVRAPSFDNWSTSYHPCRTKESTEKNEPSVVEIARKIAKKATSLPEDAISDEEALESLGDVYHKNTQGVKLQRLHGPRGPIYVTSDGSHRVAAAKLAGLKKIFASIGEIKAEKGINLWFEALREMPDEAKKELMRVYDLVYPPTDEDLTNEEVLTAKAVKQQEVYLRMKAGHGAKREREAVERALKYASQNEIHERAKKIYKKLKGDPVFEQIRKEQALEHIREYLQENKDETPSFNEEYQCNMTPDGYLLKKDGSVSNTLVTGYDVGPNSYLVVLARAVQAYENQYPDKISEIERDTQVS